MVSGGRMFTSSGLRPQCDGLDVLVHPRDVRLICGVVSAEVRKTASCVCCHLKVM